MGYGQGTVPRVCFVVAALNVESGCDCRAASCDRFRGRPRLTSRCTPTAAASRFFRLQRLTAAAAGELFRLLDLSLMPRCRLLSQFAAASEEAFVDRRLDGVPV